MPPIATFARERATPHGQLVWYLMLWLFASVLISITLICVTALLGNELSYRLQKYPPGPVLVRIPVIGSVFQPSKDLLYNVHQWASQYKNVMRLHFGAKTVIVLNSVRAVQEALVDQGAVFQNRNVDRRLVAEGSENVGIIVANGKTWRMARKLFMFHVMKAVDGKQYVIDAVLKKYLPLLENNGQPVDPNRIIKRIAFDVISDLTFSQGSIPVESTDFLIRSAERRTQLAIKMKTSGFSKWLPDQPAVKEFKELLSKNWEFVGNLVEDRKKKNIRYDDFLDMMLDFGKEELEFSEKHIAGIVFDIFTAGTDTSANTLLFFIIAITKFPLVQERLHKELDQFTLSNPGLPVAADQNSLPYLAATLKEVLRFMPVAPFGVSRVNTVDAQVCGYHIPKGSTIWTNIWSISRDAALWKDPDVFLPDRFLHEEQGLELKGAEARTSLEELKFIPFMVGRRYCPGISLAKVELFTVAAALLHNFKWVNPAGNAPLSFDYSLGATLQPKPFKVSAIPRKK
eukprot:TRINITY_DN12148_c0_g1_i1.p1 TRINITY_DN12148_c0_g1~~TRINITY_DN12148_c0_g1_i1.p1  ORF type:complete len:514 (-),score=118.45 TRINITY_DN12148_c0_g1_i1:74-1615(-)